MGCGSSTTNPLPETTSKDEHDKKPSQSGVSEEQPKPAIDCSDAPQTVHQAQQHVQEKEISQSTPPTNGKVESKHVRRKISNTSHISIASGVSSVSSFAHSKDTGPVLSPNLLNTFNFSDTSETAGDKCTTQADTGSQSAVPSSLVTKTKIPTIISSKDSDAPEPSQNNNTNTDSLSLSNTNRPSTVTNKCKAQGPDVGALYIDPAIIASSNISTTFSYTHPINTVNSSSETESLFSIAPKLIRLVSGGSDDKKTSQDPKNNQPTIEILNTGDKSTPTADSKQNCQTRDQHQSKYGPHVIEVDNPFHMSRNVSQELELDKAEDIDHETFGFDSGFRQQIHIMHVQDFFNGFDDDMIDPKNSSETFQPIDPSPD